MAAIRLRPARVGELLFVPAEVMLCDAWGMWRQVRRVGGSMRVRVYPDFAALTKSPLGPAGRSFEQALLYARTHHYLAVWARAHQRMRALGGIVLDLVPRSSPVALVNRYLEIKRSGPPGRPVAHIEQGSASPPAPSFGRSTIPHADPRDLGLLPGADGSVLAAAFAEVHYGRGPARFAH
jgi:hypothetical protein